jgi:RecB family exonuclease
VKPDRDRIVFSTSQFRTYGATDTVRLGWEADRGCPALYKARYVDRVKKAERTSMPLEYGSLIHDVLHKMERWSVGPEEALAKSWRPELPQEQFKEALDDLAAYMERGGPMNLHGTLDVELSLEAKLYDDGKYGPVYFMGIVDWIGVDSESDRILHVVDYKTNRTPPKVSDLAGDVQLKAYAWLVRENYRRWMKQKPLIVVHLDAIKFHDVEMRYTDDELDEWQAWAEAVARTILRDEKGKPQLNDGCGWCPIRNDCSVVQNLPQVGKTVAEREFGQDAEEMWQWRKEAAAIRKVLDGRMKEVDKALEEAVVQNGGYMEFADQAWRIDQSFGNTVDARGLYERIGDRAFSLLKTSKTAVEEWRKRHAPDESFDDLYGRELSGEKIVRGRRSSD